MVLAHPGARRSDAGATIQNERACLPPELVEGCIANAPGQRAWARRTRSWAMDQFHNLGGARDIHNPVTGEHRFAVLQDVRDATRLLDALPNCNTITPFFTPSDVPGELMSLAMYRHAMPFTTKPLQGPGVKTAPKCVTLSNGRSAWQADEVLTLSVSPVSPLAFPDHEVEATLEIARQGIAFAPLPCPTAGTTAPFSIAGALPSRPPRCWSRWCWHNLFIPTCR